MTPAIAIPTITTLLDLYCRTSLGCDYTYFWVMDYGAFSFIN